MSLLKFQANVSPFRGMPTDDKGSASTVTSVTGETVQFYYSNAGVYTIDAGQAAGVAVVAQLAYNNVKNVVGNLEATKQDTSLSFTSTAFTTEVAMDWERFENLDETTFANRLSTITSGFSNGQYCVDYTSGTLYGVKATTQVTLTSTAYKYQSNTTAGSGTITSIVPGTGATNLGKAEDAVHASGDTGVFSLGVGNVAQVTFAADGDYIPFAVDTKGNQMVVGNIANGAADAGNPVKTGGIYNATPGTLTTAYRGDTQIDSTGNTRTADQFAPQYEDNTNGVAQVMVKPLASATYVPTRFQNIGANATLNVKATTGNIFSVYCHNLTANDRYLQLHNTATTPGGAAVPALSFYVPPLGVLEKGMGDFFSAAGLNYATGIAFAISTTEGTYTAATATDHFTQITYV